MQTNGGLNGNTNEVYYKMSHKALDSTSANLA